MRDLAMRALNAAQLPGASYVDVRVMERTAEGIEVKNGRVEGVSSTTSSGFNVRVIVNGAWGFASSARMDDAEADRIAQPAVQIARASALAATSSEIQTRSYASSFGVEVGTAGYEFVEALDLVNHGARVAEEAVQLLSAPQCPSGVMTIILDGLQTALQVHESCGHPIELDRVLGYEAGFVGKSFLTVDKLNSQYHYGSQIVNLTADATLPGGLGSFGWDDEGVPAQRTPIVTNGIFTGYLMSRDTAPLIGRTSNGCVRADGWNRLPMIRMTNVSLEPGTWKLADLIADTDDGLYMSLNKIWSIDDRRLNFQFGMEMAYEIKNGKLGRLYKNATYTGITPQFC